MMNSIFQTKRFPFHIGMRTLKTAAATGISLLVGYAINSLYPPFLAIGALGAMQSSITASLRAARDTIVGNLIGALLAMVFTVLFTGHMAIACALGVLIMIIVCNALHIQPAITSLACVVFCCTVVDVGANGILFYGLLRFRDTVIGTVIALACNILIRPYSDVNRTKDLLRKAENAMLPLLEQRVLRGRIPDLRELRANINALDRSVDVMLNEKLNRSLKKSEVAHLRGCQQLLWKMRDSLIGICCIDTTPSPSEKNLKRMECIGLHREEETTTILDGKCSEADTTVFNYYLDIFLDSHEYLTQLIEM